MDFRPIGGGRKPLYPNSQDSQSKFEFREFFVKLLDGGRQFSFRDVTVASMDELIDLIKANCKIPVDANVTLYYYGKKVDDLQTFSELVSDVRMDVFHLSLADNTTSSLSDSDGLFHLSLADNTTSSLSDSRSMDCTIS